MDAKIIAIGNSKGVRLPRLALDQLKLRAGDPIEIEVERNAIVLRPVSRVRAGWEHRFAAAPATADLWEGLPTAEAWDE